MSRVFRRLGGIVLAAALALPASAQPRPTAPSDVEAEARAAHRRGSAAYDLGDFDGAIAAFQAAYRLSPAPGLLFNLGQAYRAKGEVGCAYALRSYTAYLRARPEAENRDIVRGHIAEMERCVEASRGRTAAAPAPPASDAAAAEDGSPSAAPPWPAILLGATGLVAVGVGIGLNVSARSEFEGLEEQCPARDCDPALWEPYEARETASFALFGVGAALVVGGALYWVIDATTASSASAARTKGHVRASGRGLAISF